MKLALIQPIAQSLLDQLSSACDRIEIAGSIRRAKPEPKDIELVCIPSISTCTLFNLLDEPVAESRTNHLDAALLTLLGGGAWAFDPVVKRNGPHYKRLRHLGSGVCCDLFITDPRRWGLIYTIRTGPADFSKALMAYARRQTMFVQDGLLHRHAPADYQADGSAQPCPAGEACPRLVATPEERDVFAALGLPWIEPGRRTPNLFYALVPRGRVRAAPEGFSFPVPRSQIWNGDE